jgi:hypothetical protein
MNRLEHFSGPYTQITTSCSYIRKTSAIVEQHRSKECMQAHYISWYSLAQNRPNKTDVGSDDPSGDVGTLLLMRVT